MRRWLTFVLALWPALASAQASKVMLFPSDPWTCNLAQEGSIYENTTSHVLKYCNGTAWTTSTGSVSGTTNNVAKFTAATAVGDATPITSTNTVASDNSTNFLRVVGTLPDNAGQFSGGASAVNIRINPFSGTTTNNGTQRALDVRILSGYSGSGLTVAGRFSNTAVSSAADGLIAGEANYGIFVDGGVNTTGGGTRVGASSIVYNSTADLNIGSIGAVLVTGLTGVGGLFAGGHSATNNVGIHATLRGYNDAFPTWTSAAAVFDNYTVAAPIALFQDNGTTVFAVGDGGDLEIARTMTAGGTVGAQTINKAAGSVNFGAGATTLVVTNSFATTTSGILAMALSNDATCWVKDVERAGGSFTIRMVAACTAETPVYWEVRN